MDTQNKVIMNLKDYDELIEKLNNLKNENQILKDKLEVIMKREIESNLWNHLFIKDEEITADNIKHYCSSYVYENYSVEEILKVAKELYNAKFRQQ